MKILLIHQYAGNKGDRAVLYSLVQLIKSQDRSAEIVVSTTDPDLWKDFATFSYQDVRFIPSAWDFEKLPKSSFYWSVLRKYQKYTFTILRESFLLNVSRFFLKFLVNPTFYKELKTCDKVISVGGHHFTTILSYDLVSSINYDAMAVLAMNKEFICFSQSFGPFDFHKSRNRQLTLKILESSSALYAREDSSEKSLLSFGVSSSQIRKTYETVLTLNGLTTTYLKPTQREKIVGIAIYATQKREPNVHKNYVDSISKFCDYVNSKGYKVRFFPMELRNTPPDDRILIHEIMDSITDKSMCYCYEEDLNTPLHLQEISKCQLFVGHKTHSTIFALACGTPLIGIAYHPKTFEFMKQYGMENYCIDDTQLTALSLNNAFDSLILDLDKVGVSLYNCSKEKSKRINDDLKAILAH